MSQCHDYYNDIDTASDAGRQGWVVRVDLQEMDGTVWAKAATVEDGFRADGVGAFNSDGIGIVRARHLAAAEALIDVARVLMER